ncbi:MULTISPECIES: hypothetical protein [unclassified Streptomyces]|uniref:hypothetical protein n=1 Tax=unclassified Streptomyces TaxID=2593676 RepID=UPI00136DCD96|nr:hypothetical protein [Streptomyces sp. YIM 132580]MXG26870.1 hypothetical protein [Streptomyces sp. YIM 132580]
MDMSWVRNGVRHSLKVVEHPDWTSLSDSGTPGAVRALLRGTGNKIVGHADLRSPALVVAGIAAVSVAVGSGVTLACVKLKSQFDDRKAKHAEAASTAEVVEAEETDAPEPLGLRAV